MKKIFFICVIIAVVSFAIPRIHALRLQAATRDGLIANNVRCARLTDELSALDGVWEAAVMQKDKAVLVGVRCGAENREQVYDTALRLVNDYFPSKNSVIGVENETALEITQLAHLLQSDIPDKVIEGRFRYLVNKSNSLFDKT